MHDIESGRVGIAAGEGNFFQRQREIFLAAAPADHIAILPCPLGGNKKSLLVRFPQVIGGDRPAVHIGTGDHNKPVAGNQIQQFFIRLPPEISSGFQHLDQIDGGGNAFCLRTMDPGKEKECLRGIRLPGIVAGIGCGTAPGRPVGLRCGFREVTIKYRINRQSGRSFSNDFRPAPLDGLADIDDFLRPDFPPVRAGFQCRGEWFKTQIAVTHDFVPFYWIAVGRQITSNFRNSPFLTGNWMEWALPCQTVSGLSLAS